MYIAIRDDHRQRRHAVQAAPAGQVRAMPVPRPPDARRAGADHDARPRHGVKAAAEASRHQSRCRLPVQLASCRDGPSRPGLVRTEHRSNRGVDEGRGGQAWLETVLRDVRSLAGSPGDQGCASAIIDRRIVNAQGVLSVATFATITMLMVSPPGSSAMLPALSISRRLVLTSADSRYLVPQPPRPQ